MKHIQLKQQQGFSILAVILVIVAVIVAIGVWALSGQTNTSNSSNSSADIQAASIVNDGGSIKLAFDTLIINGTSAANITFIPNTAGTGNMLDPTTGIQSPKPNSNAIRTGATVPDGLWVYNPTAFKGATVGTTAADQAIVLSGIKDSVCSRINNTLYGSTVLPVLSAAAPVTSATAAAPTTAAAIDLSSIAATPPTGWTSGCIATGTADSNFYFRILKAN